MNKHSHGYSSLIATLIALMMASSINNQHVASWHLQKLLGLERIRGRTITRQAGELDFIISHLTSYEDLHSIPDNFIVKHNDIALKYTMVATEVISDPSDFNGAKCKVFKAELDSSFDFNSCSEYHKKITSTYLYVLACQNLTYDASNDHQIKAFPFSNLLIGP